MPGPRRRPSPIEALQDEIKQKIEALTEPAPTSQREATKLRRALEEMSGTIAEAAARLDPIQRPTSIFDPADPKTAGRVVALTLVAQERHRLDRIPSFYGAGVYAIYYRGGFKPYAPLSGTDHPIYVGKADPMVHMAKDALTQGTKLSDRLKEHAKSIRCATSTLDIEDFDCRFLIVQSGFQKAAEDYLINFFKPIWNSEIKICYGLGKHGDSATTRQNDRSPWDTMHPGRSWADASTRDQKPRDQILEAIEGHLAARKPYRDIHQIFDQFVADMRQLDSPDIEEADGSDGESGDDNQL